MFSRGVVHRSIILLVLAEVLLSIFTTYLLVDLTWDK